MKAMMQKRFSVIILLLLCLVSLPAFAVTRYVKPGGAGTFPYTTWATGSSDLQVVINACNPGDQVWVKNSVYLPTRDITGNASPADVREKTFLLKSGVLIYGGFAGTETLLNQRNVIVNETILSGNIGDVFNSADNCYHVTYANNVTAATRLDGFTVREGNADGTGSTYSGSGGGLLNDKGQNYLTISNCNFSANTALSGAGILNSVGALGNCSPNIINCSFSLNNATGIGSGGGAISNNGYNGTSNTIIDKCRFIDNFGYNGGAVDFNAGATGSSAVTITNSLFLNNSASTGGALKITSFNDISLSAIITNCVFVSNTASNAGGAIYYGFSAGSLATTITNCSFLGNFAGTNSGGVLYVGGSVVSPNPIIKNCIAWDNSSSFDFFAGNNVTVSYSCIQSGFPGTGNISSNPFFVNAADPDGADNIWGTTDDGLRVMPISESLDKGTLTGAPGTDITGGTRPQGAGIDMGAYETYVCPLTSRLYVDESQVANSTANGTGWASPLKSLNDALQLASVSICSITEIWVKAGTYKPERDYLWNASPADVRSKTFNLPSGVSVYGGFAGTETLLSERNIALNETILSGDAGVINNTADNNYHVLLANNVSTSTRLDGFTVTKGNANSSTFSGSIINRNGGGLYNYNGQNYLTIDNCKFLSNSAEAFGGGILNTVGALGNCSPTISNSSFSLNTTTGVGASGGAIHNNSVNGTSNTIIDKCNFQDNYGYNGGALSLSAGTSGNSAVSVTKSIFSNNSAVTGSALMMLSDDNRSLSATINNCVFINNTIGAGGAIHYSHTAGSLATTITNCNFQGNSNAIYVGGATVCPNPVIKNCIAWGNSSFFNGSAGNNVTVSTSIVEGGFAGAIDWDPFFVNPTNPIGPDGIWATDDDGLRVGHVSYAIDNGNPTGAPATDIRGAVRGSVVDIGAYEIPACIVGLGLTRLYVNPAVTYNGKGDSWANGINTLSVALSVANSCSGITEVWVKAGTYKLPAAAGRSNSFSVRNGIQVYGGFAGTETLLNQRDFKTNISILSGAGSLPALTDNNYHVVNMDEGLLDGFTIVDGYANGTGDNAYGGGLRNRSSNATNPSIVRNCIFSNNYAATSGGAMAQIGKFGATSTGGRYIENCTFSANSSGTSGGALFFDHESGTGIFANAYVTNCLFTGNTSQRGGAIAYSYITPATRQHSIFTNNTFYNNTGTIAAGVFYIETWAIGRTPPVFANNIAWGNSSFYTGVAGSSLNATYSDIQVNFAGTGNINADPLFVNPLATPGGDYRLQSCSPVINMGNNSLVPSGVTTDIVINPRIAFTDVDMGAYEFQSEKQSFWKGVNFHWNDPQNWCGNTVPTAATNVLIPNTVTIFPTIEDAREVNKIKLESGTSLTLTSAGQLIINNTYTNNGSIITNNGTWIMAGSAASQTFPGTAATVNAMNNLEIKNASGIVFDKSFSISGTLMPTTGNINVNNNIAVTLKSSATATASVAAIQPAASISYTGTGSFIVERFINTGMSAGQHQKTWQFLATPTTGQTIYQSWQESGTTPAGYGTWITGTGTGFDVATTLPSLKYFNQAAVNWTAVTNTGNALVNKLGYMLFVRGDRTVTASNGNPNNTNMRSKGQLFSPTNPPPAVPVTANKYQTFGNPYASRIAFSSVYAASTGINDVFYVWDPKLAGSYNVGGYQTISGIAGYVPTVGTPPTGNPASDYYPAGVPSPYIESGQAVFVKGNGSGGNVNFNENVKVTGSRLVNRPANINDPIARRQFLFTTLFTNTGNIADGNIVAFEKGFGNIINENDAEKIMNGGENFGLMRDGSILAVEAHEPVKATDTIFYNMNNLRRQPYQLRFAPVNMGSINQQPLLIDRFTNIITPLSLTDSSFVDFNVTADPASAVANRFFIVFKMKSKPKFALTDISIKKQEVNAKTINNSEPENKKQGISIYPNPIIDGNIHLWFNNMLPGIYTVRIYNSNGQLMLSRQIEHAGGKEAILVKGDKTMAAGNYQVNISGKDNKHFSSMITIK